VVGAGVLADAGVALQDPDGDQLFGALHARRSPEEVGVEHLVHGGVDPQAETKGGDRGQ
jgi:hypothetical protein